MNQHDVILTGLPRSGTTLTCHLLNRLEDTVALHEPMRVPEFPQLGTHEAIAKHIGEFFAATRGSLLSTGQALSKHHRGAVPDNPFTNQVAGTGVRVRLALERSEIAVDKPLSPECLLVVKHPAAFTALLPTLARRFRCFAVMRNPLSVLCSWNSVPLYVRDGHAPAAERLDAKLAAALARLDDRTERQLLLLDWFFRRYRKHLPASAILRYEDTVASGGRRLTAVTPRAACLEERLESRNANELYDRDTLHMLGAKLLERGGSWTHFYTPASVKALMEQP